MKKFYYLFLFFFLYFYQSAIAQSLPTTKGTDMLMPYSKMALNAKLIGPAVEDENWYNWCVSPIISPDNKVHIFSARWPAKEGMRGWIGKNAEIAQYIGDSPEGPFTYKRTILTTEMLQNPNTMSAPHNPHVEYVDGKYILLYICQDPSKIKKPGTTYMKIGMMIADNLNGPWRFAGTNHGIMVEASEDPNHWTHCIKGGVCNPAFQKINNKYYIYFKASATQDNSYGYAVSDKLEGPYRLCDKPATDNIAYIEDAQAFSYKGKYYLITTDNFGKNTGGFGYLILWESTDGLQFKMKDAKIAMGTLFDYWGTPETQKQLLSTPNLFIHHKSGKLERPAILFKDGKPAYLYAAGDVNLEGGSVAKSYVFKIEW